MIGWLWFTFVLLIILSITAIACIGTLAEEWSHWGRRHREVRMAVLCGLVLSLATCIGFCTFFGIVIFK